MSKLIVYDKNKSYMISGESKNLKDYPTIPVGASAFILDSLEVLYKQGPNIGIQVDIEPANDSVIEEENVAPEVEEDIQEESIE